MADDTLEEMDDDFDDDVMNSLLGDMSEDASIEPGGVTAEDTKKKGLPELKNRVKRIFGSKKAMLISVVLLVLSAGIVAGVWFFSRDTKAEISSPKKVRGQVTRDTEIVFEDIVDLAPFERIRLKSSSTMGQVSMTLSLELNDRHYRKQVVAVEDRIRKIITTQAEQMTWLELRNPEGKLMLKYKLLQQINSIFPQARVRNVYFTYFIMQ